ncbi:hypothetical protein D9757_013632 [Collybiopsis confluens]|uniref:Uncharacterized protein n=1 Tax=Collybiopsis confluens TaxID=2823264 RepID=A0A8H5CZR0_9AGAR|nr:hypothetical protein D9757_013632 [Collybiopsis confluens]
MQGSPPYRHLLQLERPPLPAKATLATINQSSSFLISYVESRNQLLLTDDAGLRAWARGFAITVAIYREIVRVFTQDPSNHPVFIDHDSSQHTRAMIAADDFLLKNVHWTWDDSWLDQRWKDAALERKRIWEDEEEWRRRIKSNEERLGKATESVEGRPQRPPEVDLRYGAIEAVQKKQADDTTTRALRVDEVVPDFSSHKRGTGALPDTSQQQQLTTLLCGPVSDRVTVTTESAATFSSPLMVRDIRQDIRIEGGLSCPPRIHRNSDKERNTRIQQRKLARSSPVSAPPPRGISVHGDRISGSPPRRSTRVRRVPLRPDAAEAYSSLRHRKAIELIKSGHEDEDENDDSEETRVADSLLMASDSL